MDVGGTNTDAVLIDNRDVLGAVKRPTKANVEDGIVDAITALLAETCVERAQIRRVMIGTTHFTNAFVQARHLSKVFALRLSYPAGQDIPPFSAWPETMREAVEGGSYVAHGGYNFDGREISSLDEDEIRRVAGLIKDSGIAQVAISCVFSQLNSDHEHRAAQILRKLLPDVGISLSSELGRVGLLERENAAIMNGCLRPLAAQVDKAFQAALNRLGISAPFLVSQNDGTLMKSSHMRDYPVFTFAAGPTNSLRGAAWLTGLSETIVADIGGTTTDIGVLVNGFPRQSSKLVDVGGVYTNFRMPDILSIGLGGGSIVAKLGDMISIGPKSVGFELRKKAWIFGGNVLTASDIAVAGGAAKFGDEKKLGSLDRETVNTATIEIHRIIEEGIDRMKTSADKVPVVLVGGGSVLVSRTLNGVSKLFVPEHAECANAVGAAIGQVGGEVDKIFQFDGKDKQKVLDEAEQYARESSIAAGADPATVEIIDRDMIPIQYLPGNTMRVICRAVGDLSYEGPANA
ncbi:hydantoinase/oxoprolinase family protein [Parasphingorhabdus litoris]|uniref:hydantoinase/oxoprolinase family protein n=1 Tax=Parasphingorhabdus litoris TaxID=394733 RepID=UPI001E51D733|nr:hydantoinase/oxoprolinase family protein [Parasphingorhabdus litoris]